MSYQPKGEIRNAVIKSVNVRAGSSSVGFYVELNFGGGLHQSMVRGYDADSPEVGRFITGLCRVTEVRNIDDAVGKSVVADSSLACIHGISPILGGEWFAPEVR